MRSPLSSKRPAPTATTSPSWGFSLAVSGMTRPEAVVCSASSGLTTTRSSRGLMETDMRLSLLHEEMTLREYLGSGIPVLVVVAVPTGGEIPSDSFWHSRPSTANDANSRTATGTRATRVLNAGDRKSTRLNSSHVAISYAVFCLKKKKRQQYAS